MGIIQSFDHKSTLDSAFNNSCKFKNDSFNVRREWGKYWRCSCPRKQKADIILPVKRRQSTSTVWYLQQRRVFIYSDFHQSNGLVFRWNCFRQLLLSILQNPSEQKSRLFILQNWSSLPHKWNYVSTDNWVSVHGRLYDKVWNHFIFYF